MDIENRCKLIMIIIASMFVGYMLSQPFAEHKCEYKDEIDILNEEIEGFINGN